MEVSNATANRQTTQNASGVDTQPQAAAVLSSDFETFLQMLTTQARFQDPLEPIDSSEYAAQLAQFSMVEQQVLSNDLLTSLAQQMGLGGISQMAGWIGLEARSTAPTSYNGTPVTIYPTFEAGADSAVLVVRSEGGSEVARRSIETGSSSVQWDGRDGEGRALPEGRYSFIVESRAEGAVIGTTPAETYTRITEARRDGNETVLVLSGGGQVSAEQITALRE